MDRGKLIIVGIFGAALAMGVFAWQYRIRSGDQVIAFWGIEAATRLRHAAQVELLLLDKHTSTDKQLQIDHTERSIVAVIDITRRKGLIHARHMFITDHSYRWKVPVSTAEKNWDFALRFLDGSQEVTLVFDVKSHVVQMLGTGKPVAMGPMFDNLLLYLQPLLDSDDNGGASSPLVRQPD